MTPCRAAGWPSATARGPVLTDVDFEAGPGAGVCVLGPNGGGKTTLFSALTGELEPLAGIDRGGRPARPTWRRPSARAWTSR